MCQALVLKYSNAEPEQLLGVIPLEEVAELMRMRILVKVMAEVESEYQGRIDDAVGDASEVYQNIRLAFARGKGASH